MRSFHDAVILGFSREGDRMVLRIDHVSVGDEAQESGQLVVAGVTTFQENGRDVVAPTFAFDDGEILRLTMDARSVDMVVQWERYADRRREVATYRIVGMEARWEADCP